VNLGKKKEKDILDSTPNIGGSGQSPYKAIASALQEKALPPGATMRGELEKLESQWNRVADKADRKNLTEDINSLIRDNLRFVLHSNRNSKVDEGVVSEAMGRIMENSAVKQLRGGKAMKNYIELYCIEQLSHMR
jgi:hypothetical protein